MTTTLTRPVTDSPLEPTPTNADRHRGAWAVLITGLALFMASLDNLVVTTALPVIRVHLHAGLSGLEWTVNAYTLTFAVLLLTAATFGERFGRRRTFMIGITIFTIASAGAALAPNIDLLIVARAHSRRRWRNDHAALTDAVERGGEARTSNCGPRYLGCHWWRGDRSRTARGRCGDDRLVLALHLLAERTDWRRARAARVVEVTRVTWQPDAS